MTLNEDEGSASEKLERQYEEALGPLPTSQMPPPVRMPRYDEVGAPRAPTPTPEIDVDAWFAQREQMIEKLETRREALIAEVQETERRLRVLGVDPLRKELERARLIPTSRGAVAERVRRERAAAAPKPKAKKQRALSAAATKVLRAMSKQPEKAAGIGERLGLTYSQVWRALDAAKRQGLVKSTGTKGKDVLWSLTYQPAT